MLANRSLESILSTIRGGLLVSCQSAEGEPFHHPESMARFATSAIAGGAVGIRANGAQDIRAIRAATAAPIIGIDKRMMPDGRILITPDLDGARALVEAGADMVALDCTRRGQHYGALERISRIRDQFGVLVLADIATEHEAVAAVEAGADIVLSTMRGYTVETAALQKFDPPFIATLVSRLKVPVIAEGRVHQPAEARAALDAGAVAVVVGTAITRPGAITRWFANALVAAKPAPAPSYIAAVDMGGTNTKAGLVSSSGSLFGAFAVPTPKGGREALLQNLLAVVRRSIENASSSGRPVAAIGISTAGWVDDKSGSVAYATENLPGWSGAPVAQVMEREFGLPAYVENDADALAHAEKRFGAARDFDDFVCITLGTGVGGGCYANGALIRGAHHFANAVGHLRIRENGIECTCGLKGCLEQYANAAALVREAADPALDTAEKVIAAANRGHEGARRSIESCAEALADGCAQIIHLLDPKAIIISGGLAQSNDILLRHLNASLPGRVMTWDQRSIEIRISTLGYHSGVLGAAALAFLRMDQRAGSA